MKYIEFFSIELDHASFYGIPLPLLLTAHEDTTAWFRNNAMVVKNTQNGLKVMAPVEFSLQEHKNRPLEFHIIPDSEYFSLCTNRGDLSKEQIFAFTNGQTEESSSFQLVRSGTDPISVRYRGFRPVAVIRLMIDRLNIGNVPVHYQACFEPIVRKWKYYFITHDEALGLIVEDKQEELIFKKTEASMNSSDELASKLRNVYPKSKVLIFESNTEMIATILGRKDLQLKRKGQVLIHHLPNPNLTSEGIQVMDLRDHQ